MQGSAPRGPVLHTALWKDEDLKRLRLRGIKRFGQGNSGGRCFSSEFFPFVEGCSLHHEGSRHTHGEASPDCQCIITSDPQIFGNHGKYQSADILIELNSDFQGNVEQELRSSPSFCDRQERANLQIAITADKSDPEIAIHLAENAIFNHLGVTNNDRGYLREYYYGTTLMRDNEGRSEAHSDWVCVGKPHIVLSERRFPQEKEEDDIREYQNEIWQSLNEWLEYMYPDACRNHY